MFRDCRILNCLQRFWGGRVNVIKSCSGYDVEKQIELVALTDDDNSLFSFRIKNVKLLKFSTLSTFFHRAPFLSYVT